MGYAKAPEQLQSSARPICHSHAMTRTGREPATIRIAALELTALRTAHCANGKVGGGVTTKLYLIIQKHWFFLFALL